MRTVNRAVRVAFVLIRILLRTARGDEDGPRLAREGLESLGGAWLKFGQALALRPDILPPEYCDSLRRLYDAVPPFPGEEAMSVIRAELGPAADRLLDLSPAPLASASVAQVHEARLASGERVVVKVQRPGVATLFRSDLRLLRPVTVFVDLTGIAGAANTRTLLREFASWSARELDFTVEAEAARRMRALSRSDPREYNPRVHLDLCSPRVLTMERVPGPSVAQLLREGVAGTPRAAAIAETLHRNFLNQVYRQGVFHGDLHPANVLTTDEGVAYVDYGIVGELDREVRASLGSYAAQLWLGEYAGAAAELLRWATPTRVGTAGAAAAELERCLESFAGAGTGRGPGSALRQRDLETTLLGIVRAYRLRLRPQVALYFKTLTALEVLLIELAPTYDVAGTSRRFFLRTAREEVVRLLDVRMLPTRLLLLAADGRRLSSAAGEVARESSAVGGELGALGGRVQRAAVLAAALAVPGALLLFWASRSGDRAVDVTGAILVGLACLTLAVVVRRARRLHTGASGAARTRGRTR